MKLFIRLLLIFTLTLTIPLHSYARVHTLTIPNPTHAQYTDWGIKSSNISKMWEQGYTGKNNVKVAILDTGIDYHHPDLKVYGGVSFVNYTKDYMDDNGHGTFVAGEVGAKNNNIGVVGVAYDSKLYAVKVMDRDGYGTLDSLVKGIRWSIDNHMNIINMSLGLDKNDEKSPLFPELEKVINEAWSKNILIVAAAGNEGMNKVDYPANFKNVIAVSSVSQNYYENINRYGLIFSDFSNYGNKIEISAPGDFVFSTYPMTLNQFWSADKGYEAMSGTSMASPYVAGFLCLLKEKYKGESNIEIRNRLHEYTRDIGSYGKDQYFGYGFLFVK